MKRIQKILPAALDEELLRLGHAQNVMRRWSEVVGPTLSERSAPDRFERGVLWVAVEGSAWAQELRMMKIRVLGLLNEFAEQPRLFTDIRFGVRKLPEKPASDQTLVPPKHDSLTIREIARRRINRWQDHD